MDVGNSSSSTKMDKYWVDSPNQCHYDRNLNFAAIGSEDEEAYSNFSKKTKSARDPQSHRIIEKRRRDRMNNCLADLSRLLPSAYMKKGRGRIEKTEIIEMTIKHMKHLQVHACKEMESCEIAVQMEQLHSNTKSDQYRSGFLECITETVQFIDKKKLWTSKKFFVSFLDFVKERYLRASKINSNHHTKIHQQQQQPQQQQPQQQPQHSNDRRPTRSSSGSGGDSDESRSNRATRNSDTPSPVNPTTDGSSPTDMDNSSHSGGSNHSSCRSSSQLRQMLLASESGGSRTKSCSSSSQCSSRSNTTQQSIDDSNNVYKKFKTNIHQRFTADLEHVFPQSSCVMTPSGSSATSSLNEHQAQQPNHQLADRSFEQYHGLKRKKSDTDMNRHNNSRYGWNNEVPPQPSSPSSRIQRLNSEEMDDPPVYTMDQMQQQQQPSSNLPAMQPIMESVPIFALHPKSAFYVPMSIELSLIRTLFTPPSSSSDPNAQPLLHPVTISVNFGHPSRVLTAATLTETVASIQQHSSVIQSPVKLTRPEPLLPGSSREHGSRSPAVITANHGTATHSSRWSHLMAKRTHTP
nr:EOG090X0J7Y [Daphnia pulex]